MRFSSVFLSLQLALIAATAMGTPAATPRGDVLAWFAKLPALAAGGVKVVRMEILGNQKETDHD